VRLSADPLFSGGKSVSELLNSDIFCQFSDMTAMDRAVKVESPKQVGFLLIPGFALMSYASAIEPLRAANLLSGEQLYDWAHVAPSADAVTSSSGAVVPVDLTVGADFYPDILLVCAGGNPAEFEHKATFAWLRRLAQHGVMIGGVSGGPVVLANAGIMRRRRMTVHWEHSGPLSEAHPELMLERALYVLDRDRITCAGGAAALDMMHALVAEHHSSAFARRVSEWFLHTDIRPGSGPQRLSATLDSHRRELRDALELMENHIGDPLDAETIARRIGLSSRQLERLFRAALGMAMMAYYRGLRLESANRLLRQSALTITEVAYACGFSSGGQFSGLFQHRFGCAPREARRKVRP
jgi:transcriptional regulator GlxA family with amidase domain